VGVSRLGVHSTEDCGTELTYLLRLRESGRGEELHPRESGRVHSSPPRTTTVHGGIFE
jgi:hypothetical protein